MGSEDRFRKRKARSLEDKKRKAATRKPYDKVLVVCEGEKTEPLYFEEIRLYHELDSANIEIDGSCESCPLKVVEYALKLFEGERKSGDSYDRVYCVFDRDRHPKFSDAIRKVKNINDDVGLAEKDGGVVFYAITSNPSFEFWYLLHYEDTDKPYAPTQGKSVGDLVIQDLKKYIPEYSKAMKGLYKKSIDEGTLESAIHTSRRIYSKSDVMNDSESCTNIHELVSYLRNLKK